MKELNKRITCADGVSLSVQANQDAYCTPRIDELGHWTNYMKVEVGYIRNDKGETVTPPAEWEQYGEGYFPSPIYGYVPTNLVESFIRSHGGQIQTNINHPTV